MEISNIGEDEEKTPLEKERVLGQLLWKMTCHHSIKLNICVPSSSAILLQGQTTEIPLYMCSKRQIQECS